MGNPINNASLGEIASAIKDLGFLAGFAVAGWKLRDFIQPGLDFFKKTNIFFERSEKHYSTMESQMEVLLGNHLSHLAHDKKEPAVSTDVEL